MAATMVSRITSRITTPGVLACIGAILPPLNVYLDVVSVRSALNTQSALDPARSEFAVCGSLVMWRVVWHLIMTVIYLPYFLSAFVPALDLSARTRNICWFALYAWGPLGVVLLSASRTCETAAPQAWAEAHREVLYGGLPTLAIGGGAFAFALGVAMLKRVRARRAARKAHVLPLAAVPEKVDGKGVAEKMDEKVVVVDMGEKGVAADAKL